MKTTLHIGILNLMPTKKDTEKQLTTLLKSNTASIELHFLYPASHYRNKIIPKKLEENYTSFDQMNLALLDGFVVTGAPVERLPFSEVDYWKELTIILDQLKSRRIPRLFICWGAQAALYHYYQIDKVELGAKCVGIFPHKLLTKDHPLFTETLTDFPAPHSRYTTSKLEQLEKEPSLDIVAQSDEAGAYLVSSNDYQETYIFGHPEYDNDTLQKEYERDILRESIVPIPQHYFLDNNPNNTPLFSWSNHRIQLFSNWVQLVEKESLSYLSLI